MIQFNKVLNRFNYIDLERFILIESYLFLLKRYIKRRFFHYAAADKYFYLVI